MGREGAAANLKHDQGEQPRPDFRVLEGGEQPNELPDPTQNLTPHDKKVTDINREVELLRRHQENQDREIEAMLRNGGLDSLKVFLMQVGQYPLLAAWAEIPLAKRIERGDLAAKDKLINSNLRLVVANARRYQGQGLELMDLIQEGMLGLIRATEKYDWRKGFRFSTYGTLWIRQAIQRGLENTSRTIRLPVHVAQRSRKVGRIERELTTRLGHEPSDEEIAEVAEMALEDVIEIRKADRSVVSLDKPVGDDGDTTFGEMLELEAPSVEDKVTEKLRDKTLSEALVGLPKRERRVLEMRYGLGIHINNPKTLREAGRELGVTTERARQIENNAIERLKRDQDLAALNQADKWEPPTY